jgi:hypothetical protein
VSHRYEDFLRVFAPQPWMADAACRGMDANVFFPAPGQMATLAKEVCAECPVQAECADAGRNEVHGIWGGQAPRDRRPRRIAHGRVSGYNVGCRCDPCVEAKREVNALRNRKKTPMNTTYTVVQVSRHLLDITGFDGIKAWSPSEAIWVTAITADGLTLDRYETTVETQPRIGFTYDKVDENAA